MSLSIQSDEHFMKQALVEAEKAFELGEVPVGAIVVHKGRIIARAHNYTEHLNDVTAHAEMQAITAAANSIGGKYLTNCDIFVTLEPCIMCAGAIFWARPKRLVFGAFDAKRGFTLKGDDLIHPKTNLKTGILMEDCGKILTKFFEERRTKI